MSAMSLFTNLFVILFLDSSYLLVNSFLVSNYSVSWYQAKGLHCQKWAPWNLCYTISLDNRLKDHFRQNLRMLMGIRLRTIFIISNSTIMIIILFWVSLTLQTLPSISCYTHTLVSKLLLKITKIYRKESTAANRNHFWFRDCIMSREKYLY